MCGAVVFTAEETGNEVAACHCGMCRRWSGGIWVGVTARALAWENETAVRTIQSSAWAERGFCSRCGSGLFYRVTAEGKHHGHISVSVGSLEDTSGLKMGQEYFIDKKPEAYTLVGEHKKLTEAEVMAMFTS